MSDRAYIFLDEAGNFDFSPTGTPYFILTSVAMRRPFLIHAPLDGYRHDLLEYGLDTELFHCAYDNKFVRQKVFGIIAKHLSEIRVDSLIVEKCKTGPALQKEKRFYPEMMGYLLKYVIPKILAGGGVSEVIVITDKVPINKRRGAIEKAIKSALSEMLPSTIPYKVLHHSSCSHYSLQVADYCSWAIFRKWQSGDPEYYDVIRKAVWSEFELFRGGVRKYY